MIDYESILKKQINDKVTKVSVCVTSYNQKEYIGQCLDGLLNQKEVDFKIIIGDDCSTDGSIQILRRYEELYPDKIDLIINEKNLGLFGNRREIFKRCNSQYVAFCDGDDYYIDQNVLSRKVSFLDTNREYIGFFSSCYTDKDGIISSETDYDNIITRGGNDSFDKYDALRNSYPGQVGGLFVRNIYRYLDKDVIDIYYNTLVDDSGKLAIFCGNIAPIYRENIPTFVYRHLSTSMEREKSQMNRAKDLWISHLSYEELTSKVFGQKMLFKSQMLELSYQAFVTALRTFGNRENASIFKYIWNNGYLRRGEMLSYFFKRGIYTFYKKRIKL